MRARTLLLASFGVFSLLLALSACSQNPALPDGGEGGVAWRRDSGPRPPGTGPCGSAQNACCSGRICELGLGCGAGDVCCIEAGGGGRCSSPSECCRGLACQGNQCCAPRRAACTGSNDCCEGLICNIADGMTTGSCADPDSEDVAPGDRGCGTPGGSCCTGFRCRAGNVCVDGSCGGCGGEGENCCDGSTSCTGSLTCDVRTGRCVNVDPETACGVIDNACCEDSRGELSECSGSLVCTSGRCLRPEDIGIEGAPCTHRGTCDPGLICDRREHNSGRCVDTPDECGENEESCCDLGGDDGACEGELHCQFGDCSTCRGPSVSCLLGEISVPGQQCCEGSVCRPTPLLPRCCRGEGESCFNSLDCCGLTGCNSGTCQCSGDGSFCVSSAECCDGFVCDNSFGDGFPSFQCKPSGGGPTPETCEETLSSCENSQECCVGLVCSERRVEADQPLEKQCCTGADTACRDDEDCCGEMDCNDGSCECVVEGGLCTQDVECCQLDGENLVCVGGACRVNVEGCGRAGRACGPEIDVACCEGAGTCEPSQRSGDAACCVPPGISCHDDAQCCGRATCEDNRCVGVPENGDCEYRINECAGGLSCIESEPDREDYKCRRSSGS